MDLGILITALVGVFSNVVTGWASWFLTRKKYNSEVDNTVIQNMQESLEFYQRLSDDNRKRLEFFIEQNNKLEERDKQLEDKNDALEKEIKELRAQVFDLMQSICTDLTCQSRKISKVVKKK